MTAILLLTAWQAAAAPPTTVLLVTERIETGEKRFWWNCEARQEQPFSDELSPQLSRLGLTVVDGCDGLEAPIHKSYHRPTLMQHDVVNLGNALEARRMVYGEARFSRGKDHPRLGLVHVKLTVVLRGYDLQMERALGPLERHADGYAPTLAGARAKAVQLAVASLVEDLPELTRTPKRQQAPALNMRLPTANPMERRARLQALRGVAGVKRVVLRELTREHVVVSISPPTVRAEVEAYLGQAGLDFEVLRANEP